MKPFSVCFRNPHKTPPAGKESQLRRGPVNPPFITALMPNQLEADLSRMATVDLVWMFVVPMVYLWNVAQ